MNPKDTLNYIADMTRQLEAMAVEAGHPKVAYILRMVRSECIADRLEKQPLIEEDTSGRPH